MQLMHLVTKKHFPYDPRFESNKDTILGKHILARRHEHNREPIGNDRTRLADSCKHDHTKTYGFPSEIRKYS